MPDPPTIDSIYPDDGEGGETVHIYGTGFVDPTDVEFDSTPATDENIIDSTHMTCTSPSLSPGTYDVEVSNINGSDVLTNAWTSQSAPLPSKKRKLVLHLVRQKKS